MDLEHDAEYVSEVFIAFKWHMFLKGGLRLDRESVLLQLLLRQVGVLYYTVCWI